MHKLNTCLFQTQKLVSMRFDLDSFHCRNECLSYARYKVYGHGDISYMKKFKIN